MPTRNTRKSHHPGIRTIQGPRDKRLDTGMRVLPALDFRELRDRRSAPRFRAINDMF